MDTWRTAYSISDAASRVCELLDFLNYKFMLVTNSSAVVVSLIQSLLQLVNQASLFAHSFCKQVCQVIVPTNMAFSVLVGDGTSLANDLGIFN